MLPKIDQRKNANAALNIEAKIMILLSKALGRGVTIICAHLSYRTLKCSLWLSSKAVIGGKECVGVG